MANLAEIILGVIGALLGMFAGAALGSTMGGNTIILVFAVIGGLAIGWLGKNAHNIKIGME